VTADPAPPHAGQVRRWHPADPYEYRSTACIFTVLRQATAEEDPLFGEEAYWWAQRRGLEPHWHSESDLMRRSLPYVPPSPGQLRQMPDGTLVLLVEFCPGLSGHWVAIGPGGVELWIDGRRMEVQSDLMST
jgi:hypothetical protein